MSGISDYYYKACLDISTGMVYGAYSKLKEKYPEHFEKITKELDDNFTKKGVDKYKKSMINGFKKEELWVEHQP